MVDEQTIWVFAGDANKTVGGVFSELGLAERWIASHSLSGLLSQYPLDVGVFDWVLYNGRIKGKFAETASPEIVGSFCSHLNHYHYENGQRVA